MATEWWEEFFDGDWPAIHADMWTAEQTRSQADLVARLLGDPGPVLDVPCGEGRLSRELARRGFAVTGIDLSSELLEMAAAQADREGLEIEWVREDMREIDRPGQFSGAVCWWGSFGYFDDDGNNAFLRSMVGALAPGGRFVLDTPCLETILPRFERRGWQSAGDHFTLEERRYDPATGRIESEWTLVVDGRTSRRHSSFRLYSYSQLLGMLALAGFGRVEGIDPSTDEAFAFGSNALTLIATK
jgi:SAM-dependent methyltransferase